VIGREPERIHDDFVDSQAAYLLHALPDDELEVFETHLATCDRCRDDLAGLRLATDALPAAAPPVVPPAELKDRIMRVVRSEAELLQAAGVQADRPPAPRERRRRFGGLSLRPALVAATAAAALAIGGVVGFALRGDGGESTRTVRAQVAPTVAPGAEASLVVRGDAGTLRVANWPQAPRGRVWEVWTQRDGQAPQRTDALFTVSSDGTATAAVPSGLKGADAVLVTNEPQGGSEVPTRQPVVKASLS
jgi:Anti-sigma-K factor rskA/Putative zinc-finger